MIGLLGILLSLGLLMVLAYRGVSVILLAPVLALLAAAFDGDTPLLATYTQVFMPAMGDFIKRYFPLFLLGALLGKLMDESGASRAIAHAIITRLGAHRAILATVLSCAVLTYGGVSVFVVAFAVYPLAAAMFREANIPKRLIPGAIMTGAATFTMTCLPGSPQIQNLIPMPFFNTDSYAAPVTGLLAGALMFLGGMAWMNRRAARAARAGEGYGQHPEVIVQPLNPHRAPLITALTPLLAVLVIGFYFSWYLIPRWDTSYLTEARYGTVRLSDVKGTWAMIVALASAVVLAIVLHRRAYTGLNQSLSAGAMGSLLPIFNTASEFGYGTTIASLTAFTAIKEAIVNVSPNPLVSEAVAVNVLAGITGSASGGLSIALGALGSTYHQMALDAGIDPQLMHRVAAMSCGGLDTLPHNGAVITLLAICGLNHRQSYLDIAVVSLIVPLLVTALTITAIILFGAA